VHEPVVELELNRSGARAFLELTRTLGQRGADNALGGDPLETSQHFAMVVDGRIVSVPFINWRENPDGIDGDRGIQIAGGLTRESASTLAAVLGTGPLP
jgi:SecD/SecF fusion protein